MSGLREQGGITPAVTLPGLTIQVRNYTLRVDFLMLPLGITNIILGLDVLSALGATITCSPRGVEFNPKCNPEHHIKLGGAREEAVDKIWMVSNEQSQEDDRTVGPITEHWDPTAGWADRAIPPKGVPEELYYSDSDNFTYAGLKRHHNLQRKNLGRS